LKEQLKKSWPLCYHLYRRMRKKLNPTKPLKFFTINSFLIFASDWANKIPNKFDCVIAIPRAGLAIGQIIATKYNVPLSTPDLFMNGVTWPQSQRTSVKTVLLVDEAAGSGKTISDYKRRLLDFNSNLKVETAALITTNQAKSVLDYFYMTYPAGPVITEVDLLAHNADFVGKLACDLDGVLANDSGEPFLIPHFKLAGVVTSRPESERQLTEEWLKTNDVSYECLIMAPKMLRSCKERVNHKVQGIKKCGAKWFWESDSGEAYGIHKKTGVAVLDVSSMSFASNSLTANRKTGVKE
jgi:hypoxanthine phosphoribosyltransferase